MSDPVARINALTSNARNTWFALLGALIFVGVTLMGVAHIDFYGIDRATQLPLVNISVPTRLFFLGAPLLIAAIYGYFHLYLIRLWDALGSAPARIGGQRLGDAVSPWLVTDAALHQRMRQRKDICATPRAMEGAAAFLNFLLAWGFGLLILGLLWWQSMTARSLLMTAIAAAALLVSLWAGATSWGVMRRRMAGIGTDDPIAPWRLRSVWAAALLVGVGVGAISVERTVARFNLAADAASAEVILRDYLFPGAGAEQDLWSPALLGLAPIDLTEEALVERPGTWLPYTIAREEFRAIWCRREAPACAAPDATETNPEATPDGPDGFQTEWQDRRDLMISALRTPGFNPLKPDQVRDMPLARRAAVRPRAPDLRNAVLRGAFLSGINLVLADLRGANLREAQLEGADLEGAWLDGADLAFAQLQGAVLREAVLDGARLNGAQLQDAVLAGASLQGENTFLFEANLQKVNLQGARMQGANLGRTRMQEANLGGAQMQGAILWEAQMQGANLWEAQMQGADLRDAQMQGADLFAAQMQEADIGGAQMQGADLRAAWMERSVLIDAQMQGADLSLSLFTGMADQRNDLKDTNVSASTNEGGALRFVDLTPAIFDARSDWRNAFLDASVAVPYFLRQRLGNPCQWTWAETANGGAPLSDAEFFGRWRGWLKTNPRWDEYSSYTGWAFVAPEAWHDVPAIAPPPGCTWHSGPLPEWHTSGR